ncbi:MAG TPA: hypothetical protein DCS87_04485 [Rheinheimera sp.]|nr:hypothetical protein [Rheinheimera sp.]
MRNWQLVLMLLLGCSAARLAAEPTRTWQVGDYQVQLQASGESVFEANDCVRVLKGTVELYKKCEGRLTLGTSTTPLTTIRDLTGDQIPDLLFTSYTGGPHCCWSLYLVQLGNEVRQVQTLELTHNGDLQVRNTDADSALELTDLADWAYAYKYVGFASSFARPSVWQPVGDHFELDTNSLSEPALSPAEFKQQVLAFQASDEMAQGALPDALIWTALKLATAGHLAQAQALVRKSTSNDPVPRNTPTEPTPQSPTAKQVQAAGALFLSQLDTALYESPWWREYVYLNLSSAIREQRDALVTVPSGVVIGARQSGVSQGRLSTSNSSNSGASKVAALQFAQGVRPGHDSNYLSYQTGQISLHKVAATTQLLGHVTVDYQRDAQGQLQPQLSVQRVPVAPVAKTFTLDYVRTVRAQNEALLASVPKAAGEHSLTKNLVSPLLGNCPTAQLSVVTEQVLNKLYPSLAIQLPNRPRLVLPWGANLEYLSCGNEQPTLVGLLTCRGQGYCGQLLLAQP